MGEGSAAGWRMAMGDGNGKRGGGGAGRGAHGARGTISTSG
jgi:hypothetical protein